MTTRKLEYWYYNHIIKLAIFSFSIVYYISSNYISIVLSFVSLSSSFYDYVLDVVVGGPSTPQKGPNTPIQFCARFGWWRGRRKGLRRQPTAREETSPTESVVVAVRLAWRRSPVSNTDSSSGGGGGYGVHGL